MHPAQGWGYQPPPFAPPRRRGSVRGGIKHQLVIGLVLFTLGFFRGLTTSGRGLLAIGLAWVVVGFLARRRVEGWREWCKAVVEYATVAALVVAVLTAAPIPPKAEIPPRRRPPAAERAQGDPWKDVRARFAELAERLPRVEVTTTKEGR